MKNIATPSCHTHLRKCRLRSISPLFILLILMAILGESCSNNKQQIAKITMADTLPDQLAKEIQILYSEFGELSFCLTAPILEIYQSDDGETTIFPKGIVIDFFDSIGNVKSQISSHFAIKKEKEEVVIAKENVIINNFENNERLNTEELVWDQKNKTIHNNVFVSITQENQVLYGENGIEADETLSKWKIKKIKGSMEIKDDE